MIAMIKICVQMAEVQLQILTATVKLFLKRPGDTRDMMESVLGRATNDSDNPDLRDRWEAAPRTTFIVFTAHVVCSYWIVCMRVLHLLFGVYAGVTCTGGFWLVTRRLQNPLYWLRR